MAAGCGGAVGGCCCGGGGAALAVLLLVLDDASSCNFLVLPDGTASSGGDSDSVKRWQRVGTNICNAGWCFGRLHVQYSTCPTRRPLATLLC